MSTADKQSGWLRNAQLLGLSLFLLPLLFSTRLSAPIPVAAACFWGILLLARTLRTGRLGGHTPADWPLLLLLLLLPLGLAVSAQRALSLPHLWAWIAGAALFWLMAAQHDHPWLRYSGWLLIAAGLGLAAAVFVATEFPSKLPWLNWDVRAWQPSLPLVRGSFNPNNSGSLMSLLVLPALTLALRSTGSGQRLAAGGVALLLGLLLLISQSRGAILGVGVACVALTLLISRRWLPVWLMVALAALIAVRATGIPLNWHFLLGGSALDTLIDRQLLWQRGLYLIHDFPFTGVGPGMVEPAIQLLYPLETARVEGSFFHVHQTYLQFAAEMGLLGLLAWVALLGSLAAGLLHVWRNAVEPSMRTLALALLGSLIVYAVHSFFDVPTHSPLLRVLLLGLMGLMAAVSRAAYSTT